jgi:hypothetical protein
MYLPDGLGEDPGAKIGEIVAIHGGDNRMAELHFCHSGGDSSGLGSVIRRGPAMSHRAIATVARADIAQDHEGGGAVFPAFANVRAACFLADSVQTLRPQERLELEVVRAAGGANFEPAGLTLG